MEEPLISVVLPTKNSMPHLKTAIGALEQQSYRKFEVVVQDGGSTDGTLEYLDTIKDLPKLSIVSQKDSGVGEAFSLGIKRSEGDFVCLAASDEYLFRGSLQMGIDWFKQYPQAASIYGAMALVNEAGTVKTIFSPPPFDLIEFMRCELFPTTAGLLNRKVIGDDFYYDEQNRTCPDYDFWMRLGLRFGRDKLIARDELFMAARADRTSSSFRVEVFEDFCKEKCFALDRFINNEGKSPFLEAIRDSFKASIYRWGAQMALNVDGPSEYALKLCAEAAKIDPRSPGLSRILESFSSGQIESVRRDAGASSQKFLPPDETEIVQGAVNINELKTWPAWGAVIKKIFTAQTGARKLHGLSAYLSLILTKFLPLKQPQVCDFYSFLIKGGPDPSGYSAILNSKVNNPSLIGYNYWWKICFNVKQGRIGFLSLLGSHIIAETYYSESDTDQVIHYIPIKTFEDLSLIIRNGGQAHSEVNIYDISIVSAVNEAASLQASVDSGNILASSHEQVLVK